jgi:hypothetical protein
MVAAIPDQPDRLTVGDQVVADLGPLGRVDLSIQP